MQSLSPASIRMAVKAQASLARDLFDRLAACGPSDSGIMRDTYGAGENRAHDLLAAYGESAGLSVRRDVAANTYVRWPGREAGAALILMGSHLDSVPHGGNFDGAAGVVAGLVVIAALRKLGVTPARAIEVMGIRAEESVWFQVSYVGSRSALGSLPEGALEARRFDTGRTLAEHMTECGGDVAALAARRRSIEPGTVAAFIEVHIEQAPALVEAQRPTAICTGIPGNFRYPNARIIGRHDHVGTPRRFRRDAAMAGADLAMAVDAAWRQREAAGIAMAATFGRFHTDPAVHGMTTVPGTFHFSLDVRAYDADVLARFEAEFLEMVAGIAQRRNVVFELGKRASASVGRMDAGIAAELHALAATLDIPTLPLGSPASHDAAAFAEAGIPTAMIFVRNEHGSHNPDEHMEIDDFLDACSLLACWVAHQAETGKP